MLEESLNINFEGSFYYKGILQMQDEITLDQREGLNIGESSQSLNEAGSYDINSMRVTFYNKDFWASERFALESPLKRKMSIYMVFAEGEFLIFTGTVDEVQVEPQVVYLNLIA